MSDYLDLADEIEALPPNTAFRLTHQAQRTIVAALRLVLPTEELMAYLGHHGHITPHSELVEVAMAALHEVDPK